LIFGTDIESAPVEDLISSQSGAKHKVKA